VEDRGRVLEEVERGVEFGNAAVIPTIEAINGNEELAFPRERMRRGIDIEE
jgi:hypothetical protein